MKRSRVFLLAIMVAAVLWGASVPQLEQAGLPAAAASVRLTDAEADCIVGGKAGCLDEAASAYGGCVIENVDPEDPSTMGAFATCLSTGFWTGVVCAFTWLWGVFF